MLKITTERRIRGLPLRRAAFFMASPCAIIKMSQEAGKSLEKDWKFPGFLRSADARSIRECVLDSETRQLSVAARPFTSRPRPFSSWRCSSSADPKPSPRARSTSASGRHVRFGGTLTSLLVEVRSAIGDSARDPHFVRTVHRFGYAFSGTAEELRGSASPAGGQKLIYRLIWEPAKSPWPRRKPVWP